MMSELAHTQTHTHVQIRLFMTPIICLFYMYGTHFNRQSVLCITIRPLSPDKKKIVVRPNASMPLSYVHEGIASTYGCSVTIS